MAKAAQKITLSSSRDIPFNKLVLSQSNVRRIKAGVSVEELASSIARRGLIQSLHVRPVLDADGLETGMFEVPAGGRRYRALELLVKQKRLARTAPVPCIVGDAGRAILREEISLAENEERIPPHPLDQYRAFQTMRDKGMTEEAIAAAFLIDVNVVKQRLRLASVSPVLLDLYAEDGIDLRQLMAFTVSQDHARQEQVWAAIREGWQKEPWQIRRMLTEKAVRASDKRAVFVGIEAYEAAGGVVVRDLFEDDSGGWLQDPVLLDRLVGEKLKTIADEISSEGWKWVEAAVSFPYGAAHGLRKLSGIPLDMSAEEQATREALQAEYNRLSDEHEGVDELPDEIDQRLGEIETAMEALDDRPFRYDRDEIAMAGVFVSIGSDGSVSVDRGYVRPEDEIPAESGNGDIVEPCADDGDCAVPTVVTIGGQPADAEDDEEDGIKPLPDRLLAELTAHRTLALRDAVGAHPHVALTALLHKLVRDTFQRFGVSGGSLQVSVGHVSFRDQGADLAETPYATSIDQRHADWKAEVPSDENALWDWLAVLDEASRLALLAHCVSFGINALHERPNLYGGNGVSRSGLERRMEEADRLARATGLDMAEAGFRPTIANYLGRVTKSRILSAVREGAGERAADLIAHLKKDDMAQEAERLLADTGWLPEPLRLADPDGEPAIAEAEDDEPAMIAAE